jgi:CheY-like chemotaxis protein
MTPAIIARAFDPFFTTKPIGQGSGLGLSMVYGFARQSGGQVRIYSEVGGGTMVCVYLPRHLAQESSEQEQRPPMPAPKAAAEHTVLVVEDEPVLRMLIVDVMTELGYATLEAEDSASGLKILQSAAPIDLLISDIGLPGGMNGRQMAETALRGRPDLKVLFITGYAENAVFNHGHLTPGMQVLTKPFEMNVMASKVHSLIKHGEQTGVVKAP